MTRKRISHGPTRVGERLRAQTFTDRKAEASRTACRGTQAQHKGEHMVDPEDDDDDDVDSTDDNWPGPFDEDQYTRAERGDR